VSEAEAVIFFYDDFLISRISSDFKLEHWATNLRRQHQFAITETTALFIDQCGGPPDVAYLGRFEMRQLVDTQQAKSAIARWMGFEMRQLGDTQQVRLLLSDGSSLPKGQFLGRGKHMYFFGTVGVYRASLDSISLDSI
jgi:hypothetical protein